MKQQPRAETVEEFKLRIAGIMRAKPEQIPAAKRLRRLKRRPTRKQNDEPPASDGQWRAAILRLHQP
jgi:hypothetical protein